MATRVGVNTVRATFVACAATMPLMPLPALGLGLGELEMQSFLNEPLRAEVALLDLRELTEDDIRIRLAGVEDFERLGIDRSYFLTSIRFDVQIDEATGRGVILLSTPDAVLEPFLDIIVEARWPNGRVLREYTVLIDPPAFRQDMITVSASERVQDVAPDKPALAEEDRGAMDPDAQAGDERVLTSGDSVAVRESSLAPGAMPDRAFSAQTSDTPVAGSRYMIKRDETLWEIASRSRPEDISVQQAMLDIQRVNPEAFIDNNINRIKAGYIVYLPAAGEVSSANFAEALDEVRSQNEAFASRSIPPGVTAAATLRVSADTEVLAPEEDLTSADAVIDLAERDAGEDPDPVGSGTAAADPDMEPDGAEMSTDPEVAAQLTAMSERVDTLEQIVTLKDEQIATLEQALREAREEAAAAAARPAPAPAPQAPSSSSTASGGIPWLPIGGGLLALLLGGAFLMRRRSGGDSGTAAAESEDDVFANVALKKEPLEDAGASAAMADVADGAEAADAEKDELGRGGSRGYGENKHDDYIDDAQGGDALAEADIYIAYGRYLQAVELLATAIETDPDNSAYRLKLIELYVDMGEEGNAAEQLEALRQRGDTAAIERGEALVGAASQGSSDPFAAADPAATPDDASAPEAASSDYAASEAVVAEPEESLELDMDPEPDAAVEDAAAEALASNVEELDEELEFNDLQIESEPGSEGNEAPIFSPTEPEEVLDLTDALSEFEDTEIGGEDAEADAEDNGLMVAEGGDEVAAKLDLARAYIEMGDGGGARGILEEIAGSGSGNQQQEARELLSRID